MADVSATAQDAIATLLLFAIAIRQDIVAHLIHVVTICALHILQDLCNPA